MRHLRKSFYMFAVIALLCITGGVAYAGTIPSLNEVSNREAIVKINDGEIITRVGVNDKREYSVKLRELAEYLGFDVSWDGEKRSITLTGNEMEIVILLNEQKYYKNGSLESMTTPVYIADNYSYMPKSFLEQALGAETASIDWMNGRDVVTQIHLLVPYAKATNKQPLPKEADIIEGKPLYIDYYENIWPGLSLGTAAKVIDIENGGEQVVVYCETPMTDFRICSLGFRDNKEISFYLKEYLTEPCTVGINEAVLIKTYVPCGIPTQAIVFTDSSGEAHSYVLSYNGKDGSVWAMPIKL